MAEDIRKLLLAAFDVEHREHVAAIRGALGSATPDWNDVFRRAHSLKGASRAVDLPAVEAVAHRLETLFEGVRTGTTALDREAANAVHAKATISMQEYCTEKTLPFIGNHGQEVVAFNHPVGVKGTDEFLMAISRISGKEIPEELAKERGRLVDAIADSNAHAAYASRRNFW